MKTELPWDEKVPMLSINPDTASPQDVARLASELMEMRQALYRIYNLSLGDHDAYRIAFRALNVPPHPTHHIA